MKTGWFAVVTVAVLFGAGCKDNATATAACKAQGDSATCQTCCSGNGANGYKFSSGSCSCLGGTEGKAATAAPVQPAQVAQPAQPVPPAQPAGFSAGAFTLTKLVFARGEPILVTYNRDMTTPPGQQHWITVAKPTDVESAWGVWHYVPQGARTDTVTPPTPGEWEIRLHDVYPRNASKVIARQRITVQ